MKYKEGDVIGTITLIITEVVCEDEMFIGAKENLVLEDYIGVTVDTDELDELSMSLNPSKRKELLLAKRAEIDKELENLQGN